MTADDMIKLGVGVATAVGMFGAGSFTGSSTEQGNSEGWCGAALSAQAQHYNELLDEIELEEDE